MIYWQERHLLYHLNQRGWKDDHVAPLSSRAYRQLNYPPSTSQPERGRIWNKVLKQRLGDSTLIDLLKKAPEKFR